MEEKIASRKRTARLAGLLYLILAIGGVGIIYVPSQIVVRGDDAASFNNLLAKEFLFRTGIVCQLISSIVFIYLVMVLYRLLKPVNEYRAELMVALVIVQIPIVFLAEALHITALMIAKGELLKSINATERKDFTLLFLKEYNYSIVILQIFRGLWLIPFG